MKIKVIKIGNTKGIILSQFIIDKYTLNEEVYFELRKEYFLLKPVRKGINIICRILKII